jgi:hypothetical protein
MSEDLLGRYHFCAQMILRCSIADPKDMLRQDKDDYVV